MASFFSWAVGQTINPRALSINKKKCHPPTGQHGNRDCHFRRGLFDPDEHHGDFPDLACRTGGAVGVGLGFGLQKIASNFISGVILLLEGQATVGDYVELDGGEAGTIIKTTARSMILETYDGRWIVVPNEDFITTRVVNYSDQGSANRYEADFSVSYDTEINLVPALVEVAVSKHPEVLDDPFPPDCELRGFGESGINFAVEFWVNGIDDGKTKYTSDVLFIIWNTLQENDIKIPYPHRVVEFKNMPDIPEE